MFRSFWLFAFILFTLSTPAYSKDVSIEIEDISTLLLDWRMSGQDKISDEIFDAIGSQSFSVDLNDYISGNGKVQRRYFDNGDGSFTIFDILCSVNKFIQ